METSPPAKKVKLNTIDPIMMVPIGKKKCFKFVRPNGTIIRFNIESLVDYLLSSGDFNDPETRIPFSDADLTEIDAIVSVSNSYLVFDRVITVSYYLAFSLRRRRVGSLRRLCWRRRTTSTLTLNPSSAATLFSVIFNILYIHTCLLMFYDLFR